MSSLLFNATIEGVQRVLDLRLQQHALTATNLANADTPGFKARTIDFGVELRAAMSPDRTAVSAAKDPAIIEIEAPPWSVDGNSVVLEREAARLEENTMMYRALSTGLSRRLALLRYAASDGK